MHALLMHSSHAQNAREQPSLRVLSTIAMIKGPFINVRLPTRLWEIVQRVADANLRSATAELAHIVDGAITPRETGKPRE